MDRYRSIKSFPGEELLNQIKTIREEIKSTQKAIAALRADTDKRRNKL